MKQKRINYSYLKDIHTIEELDQEIQRRSRRSNRSNRSNKRTNIYIGKIKRILGLI